MAQSAPLEGMLLAAPNAISSRGVPVTALPMVIPGAFAHEAGGRRVDLTQGRRRPTVAQALPLVLDLRILLDADGVPCPLLGAQVEVAHLDAAGRSEGLCGAQMTGLNGRATFRTVFPGWSEAEPPQIHLRVRYMLDAYRHASFASPLFFPDTLADAIYEWRPYRVRPTEAVRNAQDPVFGSPLAGGGHAGDVLTLRPRPAVFGHGYVVRRDVVLLSPSRPHAYAG